MDASGHGIREVLSQKGHPVEYFSQKLSNRMQEASTYHREMLAITKAVGKWCQYLLSRRFTIYTDQKSLKSLTDQIIQTPEHEKWLIKLVGFDFQIIYHPDKMNHAADSLSRIPEVVFLSILVRGYDLEKELKTLNQTHPELTSLQRTVHDQGTSDVGFTF